MEIFLLLLSYVYISVENIVIFYFEFTKKLFFSLFSLPNYPFKNS